MHGLFRTFYETSFKKDSEGNILFFPYGEDKPAYLIPSDTARDEAIEMDYKYDSMRIISMAIMVDFLIMNLMFENHSLYHIIFMMTIGFLVFLCIFQMGVNSLQKKELTDKFKIVEAVPALFPDERAEKFSALHAENAPKRRLIVTLFFLAIGSILLPFNGEYAHLISLTFLIGSCISMIVNAPSWLASRALAREET